MAPCPRSPLTNAYLVPGGKSWQGEAAGPCHTGLGFQKAEAPPKTGPCSHPPCAAERPGFPLHSPGEFRLGATGPGCSAFPALGVAEEGAVEEVPARPVVGEDEGPLSPPVTDCPLGRSPAPHLGHGGAPQRFFQKQPRWRGLGRSCVSGEGNGQSVRLRDSCVGWTGARTGLDLESRPRFRWRFM